MALRKAAMEQLARAGWFVGRKINTTAAEQAMMADGYTPQPNAVAFLQEFGGLSGEHPPHSPGPNKHFFFDAQRAIGDIYRERVDVYSSRFGATLIPVGEIDDGYITILISEDGSMLGALDDYLWLLGQSTEDGLNSIFERTTFLKLP